MRILENPVVLVALIVLVIVLFGAKRLPDVAKSVGSSLKIFKKEVKDLRDDEQRPAAPSQADAASSTTPSTTTPSTTPPPQADAPATPPAGPQDPADGTRPSSTGSTTS